MSIVGELVGFVIRQYFGVNADQVINSVEKWFTDHSQTLPKALARANDRSWKAVAIALAGNSFLDKIGLLFASGDDKAIREQVTKFLESNAIQFEGNPADFRKRCLAELKHARKVGLLSAENLSSREIARRAANFQRFADTSGLVKGAWQAMVQVVDALPRQYHDLPKLLKQPTPGGPPLLAVAFTYFFQREVETDAELAHGLFFDSLRQLSATQAKSFAEVGKALDLVGDKFDRVFEQLGRIETVVVETQAVVIDTQGALLNLEVEFQRWGSLLPSVIRQIFEDVLSRQAQIGMRTGVVQRQHSLLIRSEDERREVKQLLARFRQLPADQQKQVPALLNELGKLQIGAGEFDDARQSFLTVAHNVTDASAKAEALFNAYCAALEKERWDEALAAIMQAATVDATRFALFPLHRYKPKRILGAGGFGTVFLCHDELIDEDVVVKTLHTADMERSMADVFQEAAILKKLIHPAVIGVQWWDFANPATKGRPYIVMNYFLGGSLQAFVRERGKLAKADLIAVARQIAQGMKAAHDQKVLHRDLKPDNVLVRKQGNYWEVKIIDFGLALRKEVVETTRNKAPFGDTPLIGSVAGTVKYAPPEQMREINVATGPYSDVYSFGKLCCYALFKTTEPKSRHWEEEQIAPVLKKLLEECLEEEPKRRPANFAVVLERLAAIVPSAEKGQKRVPSQPSQKGAVDADNATILRDVQACERLNSIGKSSREHIEKVAPSRIALWTASAQRGSAAGQWLLGECTELGICVPQDYAKAMYWYRKAADQGHALGQNSLGVMYFEGKGVQKDDTQAVYWVRKAAEQGDPDSQYILGRMYFEGKGVQKDDTQAVYWVRKAADQGSALAQANLGSMYFQGMGLPQDFAQAIYWYRRAADQGNAEAQNDLGWMYENGQGMPQDFAQAMQWFRKAADQGDAEAQNRLGVMYFEGKGVRQDYAQAMYWYRKAADQGSALAQTNLGWMYFQGIEVRQDFGLAMHWYRKAADQGVAVSQARLGWMYFEGKGVRQDYAQAMYWYRKAADQGDAEAQNDLGRMYFEGKAVPKDDAQALYWFRKAADQGHAEAQNDLGWMNENGWGVPKDDAQALYWFRKAADQGHAGAQVSLGKIEGKDYTKAAGPFRKAAEQGQADAQVSLGKMYRNGDGVPKDDAQAMHWFRKAADQGDPDAQYNIGLMSKSQFGITDDAMHWFRKAAEQGHGGAQFELGMTDSRPWQALAGQDNGDDELPQLED